MAFSAVRLALMEITRFCSTGNLLGNLYVLYLALGRSRCLKFVGEVRRDDKFPGRSKLLEEQKRTTRRIKSAREAKREFPILGS